MDQAKREELEKSLCTRIAAWVTEHRSEAVLPAAHCDRPRIGLFAPGGILRDGAWQVYGLDQPITDAVFEAGGFPLGIASIPVIRGLDTFEIFADPDAFRAVFDALWPMMLNLDGLLLPGGAPTSGWISCRCWPRSLRGSRSCRRSASVAACS